MTWLYYLIRDLPLKPIGFFERLLTRFQEIAGTVAITAYALTYIALAIHFGVDLRCRPGEVTTTNGRELCKASSANTSVKSYGRN
jgi:hypothetical protein